MRRSTAEGATSTRRERRRLRVAFTRALGAAAVAAQLGAFLACSGQAPATPGAGGATGAGGGGESGGEAQFGAGGSAPRDCKGKPYSPDAAHNCGEYVYLPCGPPADAAMFSACYFEYADCQTVCGNPAFNCHAAPGSCDSAGKPILDDDGGMSVECAVCLGGGGGVGRRPRGLRLRAAAPSRRSSHVQLGVSTRSTHPGGRGPRGCDATAHLARAAALEAASAVAFERLAEELAQHLAPRPLVAAALRSAGDERRHARATEKLAARRGTAPSRANVRRRPPRSLAALAVENAVEGCVHETFGALVNAWQARRARDADVAALARRLARDELAHAALAWEVHAFAASRLSARENARVAQAARRAIARLWRAGTCDAAAELGLPLGDARAALLAALESDVWSRGWPPPAPRATTSTFPRLCAPFPNSE